MKNLKVSIGSKQEEDNYVHLFLNQFIRINLIEKKPPNIETDGFTSIIRKRRVI